MQVTELDDVSVEEINDCNDKTSNSKTEEELLTEKCQSLDDSTPVDYRSLHEAGIYDDSVSGTDKRTELCQLQIKSEPCKNDSISNVNAPKENQESCTQQLYDRENQPIELDKRGTKGEVLSVGIPISNTSNIFSTSIKLTDQTNVMSALSEESNSRLHYPDNRCKNLNCVKPNKTILDSVLSKSPQPFYSVFNQSDSTESCGFFERFPKIEKHNGLSEKSMGLVYPGYLPSLANLELIARMNNRHPFSASLLAACFQYPSFSRHSLSRFEMFVILA